MQKICFWLIFVYFLAVPAVLAKNTEPVQSTQGIEIAPNIEKSKPTKIQKNEQKYTKNRSKKYIEAKQKIQKQDYKRTLKQKELEYLEKRLEVKKQKLELLNPDNSTKGEKE